MPEPVSSQDRQIVGTPRWLRLCEWLLFALLAVQFGARTLPTAWKTLNTDFPNYYLTASLLHEHFDTSRVYEWIWIERQKDHRQIDQRIVGMVPITPFSTLAVYPLTGLPSLVAKHYWIIFNGCLLLATIVLLHKITALAWRQIVLITALSFPLRLNFLYGQYYVLLLFLLTLACYLYLHQRRLWAGIVIGIAAGLKIFPVIYLLYFLRKRDFRAFAGGVISGVCAAIASVLTFGWQLHGTYLSQVLPATLRGEGLDPYNLQAASLSSLLHRLFVYEPQLNPHPAIDAAWLFAVSHPLLQMVVMAPALLLAAPKDNDPRRVRLEWAAILVASLAISTSPGSYLFTLLILPACFLLEEFAHRRRFVLYIALLTLYIAAGVFGGSNQPLEGWKVLLLVPRLYVLLLLCVFGCMLLVRQRSSPPFRRDTLVWAAALGIIVAVSITGNLRHQRGLYDQYQWRVATPDRALMTVHPALQGDALHFIALFPDGYRSGSLMYGAAQISKTSSDDMLAVTANNTESWVERAGRESTLIPASDKESEIHRAESPVASPDGHWLAYLRVDRGRGRIWVQPLDPQNREEKPLSPPELNISEMSFQPDGAIVFSATNQGAAALFVADQLGKIRPLGIENARYPAVSPDGQWLAYSQLDHGNWNLWLRDWKSGETQRLTHAECNSTEPAWAADSKTLYYASDCGRALWFSVICKRRVVP